MKFFVYLSFLLYVFSVQGEEKIISVYYDNSSQYRPPTGHRKVFAPNMIDTTLLTDIYYAFAYFGYVTKSIDPNNPHLTGDFSIQPTDSNDQQVLYPQIMTLKKNNNLKVILSIGGWNFNDPNDPQGAGRNTYRLFSQMVASKSNRAQFIDSAIAYAHKFGFDGVDIDWEYPGNELRGGSSEDFPNFLLFLQECSTKFRQSEPPLLLTYSVPPFVPFGTIQKYRDNPNLYFQWIAECSRYVDRLNIMAYDYHGPFNDPKITGANAPLNRDTEPTSNHYIAKTLDWYVSNGVPASKIILGIPVFGHSYQGVVGLEGPENGPGRTFISAGEPGPSTKITGLLAYYEVADLIAQKQMTFGVDGLTSTAFAYQPIGGKWISFDTPDTVSLKAQMARSKDLGGVMLWTIDMDEYEWEPRFPNIRSAKQELLKDRF